MENRAFRGVWIPREIWLHKEFSLQEKALLVEIDSLSTENGCEESNEYFAKFLGVNERRLQYILSNLKAKGYIETAFEYEDGTQEIRKRHIKICSPPYPKTYPKEVVQESAPRGAQKCVQVVQESAPPPEKEPENCQNEAQTGSETDIENGRNKDSNYYIYTPLTPQMGGTGSINEMITESKLHSKLKEKLCEWLRYKAEKRQTYKCVGLRQLVRQAERYQAEYGARAVYDLIDVCMANNWQGIIWDKLKRGGASGRTSERVRIL